MTGLSSQSLLKVDCGLYVKGWCGHDLDPPGGTTGLYHQYPEILNNTSRSILMGIMAVNIGRIQKDSPNGEWTVRNMSSVNQEFPLVEIYITDFTNIGHLPQT